MSIFKHIDLDNLYLYISEHWMNCPYCAFADAREIGPYGYCIVGRQLDSRRRELQFTKEEIK